MWLKFTKAAATGYIVSFELGFPSLEPALPLDYLDRLLLQNDIFADEVKFVGVGGDRPKPRIVTRQPHIKGVGATPEEIGHLMTTELGFRQLPQRFSVGYADALAFIRGDVAVFDLRSANVVKTEEGLIVPIDTIPVRLSDAALKILEETDI